MSNVVEVFGPVIVVMAVIVCLLGLWNWDNSRAILRLKERANEQKAEGSAWAQAHNRLAGEVERVEHECCEGGDGLAASIDAVDTRLLRAHERIDALNNLRVSLTNEFTAVKDKVNSNFRLTAERFEDHKKRFRETEDKFTDLLKSLANRVTNCDAELRRLREMFPSLEHRPTSLRTDLTGLENLVVKNRRNLAEMDTALAGRINDTNDRINRLEEANIVLTTSNRDLNLRVETLEKEAMDGAQLAAMVPFVPSVTSPMPPTVWGDATQDGCVVNLPSLDRFDPPAEVSGEGLPADFPTDLMQKAQQEAGVFKASSPRPYPDPAATKRRAIARVLGEFVLSGLPKSPGDLRQALAVPQARECGAEGIGEAILCRLEQTINCAPDALPALAAKFLAERDGGIAAEYQRIFTETGEEAAERRRALKLY